MGHRLYVLTVPMRNGNILASAQLQPAHHCSYRTYEEWKLDEIDNATSGTKGSYRTYEEWKPVTVFERINQLFKVLTVPMRNGNLLVLSLPVLLVLGSYRTYEEWKPPTVTEMVNMGKFLPYL